MTLVSVRETRWAPVLVAKTLPWRHKKICKIVALACGSLSNTAMYSYYEVIAFERYITQTTLWHLAIYKQRYIFKGVKKMKAKIILYFVRLLARMATVTCDIRPCSITMAFEFSWVEAVKIAIFCDSTLIIN